MSEQLPPPAVDEPRGDQADQASRLQMEEEQAAIRAALAGDVHGTDAYEGPGQAVDVLEGPEPLDAEGADASDDPVYGGGMPATDPGETALATGADADPDLAMTGVAEDASAYAVDEGGTVVDDGAAPRFEEDGDPDILGEDLPSVDDESAAEDLDALIDVLDLGHDLDDPQDPDGYGVPPDPQGGSAVVDEAELRDPVDDER